MKNKEVLIYVKHSIFYSLIISIIVFLGNTITYFIIENKSVFLFISITYSLLILYYISYISVIKIEKKINKTNPELLCWLILVFFILFDRGYIVCLNILNERTWYEGLFITPGLLIIFMPIIIPIIYDKIKIKKGEA